MLFIRPSKTISLGFDNNSLDYELQQQQHQQQEQGKLPCHFQIYIKISKIFTKTNQTHRIWSMVMKQ